MATKIEAFLLFLLVSCTPTPRPLEPSVSLCYMGHSEYDDHRFRYFFAVTNTSDVEISFPSFSEDSEPYDIEMLQDGEWVTIHQSGECMTGKQYMTLKEGDTYQFDIALGRFRDPWRIRTHFWVGDISSKTFGLCRAAVSNPIDPF